MGRGRARDSGRARGVRSHGISGRGAWAGAGHAQSPGMGGRWACAGVGRAQSPGVGGRGGCAGAGRGSPGRGGVPTGSVMVGQSPLGGFGPVSPIPRPSWTPRHPWEWTLSGSAHTITPTFKHTQKLTHLHTWHSQSPGRQPLPCCPARGAMAGHTPPQAASLLATHGACDHCVSVLRPSSPFPVPSSDGWGAPSGAEGRFPSPQVGGHPGCFVGPGSLGDPDELLPRGAREFRSVTAGGGGGGVGDALDGAQTPPGGLCPHSCQALSGGYSHPEVRVDLSAQHKATQVPVGGHVSSPPSALPRPAPGTLLAQLGPGLEGRAPPATLGRAGLCRGSRGTVWPEGIMG